MWGRCVIRRNGDVGKMCDTGEMRDVGKMCDEGEMVMWGRCAIRRNGDMGKWGINGGKAPSAALRVAERRAL